MKRTKLQKLNSSKCTYAVVKFIEKLNKLFEGIPESWFVNEEQTACFWPPKNGRSVTLRAIAQDEPDWDWEVYECEVVSLGHETYSIAASVVRDKCAQLYNTSSADDHIEEDKFKRAHPGLVQKVGQNLETVFKKTRKSENESKEPGRKIDSEIINPIEPLPPSSATVTLMHQNAKPLSGNAVLQNPGSKKSRQNHNELKGGQNVLLVNQENPNETIALIEPLSPSSATVTSMHQDAKSLLVNVALQNAGSKKSHHDHNGLKTAQNAFLVNQENPGTSKLVESSSSGIKASVFDSGSKAKTELYNRLREEYRSRCKVKSREASIPIKRSKIRSRSPMTHSSRSCSTRSSGSRSSRHSYRNLNRSASRSSRHSYRNSCRNRSASRSSHHSSHNSSWSRSHRSGSGSIRRSGDRHSSRSTHSSRTHSGRGSLRSRSNGNSSSRSTRRSGSCSTRSSGSCSTRRSGGRSSRHSYRNLNRSASRSTRHSVQNSNRSASRISRRNSIRSKDHGSCSTRRYGGRYRRHSGGRSSCSSRNSSGSLSNRQVSRRVSAGKGKINSAQENDLLKTLVNSVNKMENVLNKIERRTNESDRRLSRVEITSNKTYVLVGDLVNAHDARMLLGHVSQSKEMKLPRGYRMPKLPVKTLEELAILRRDLRNKDFVSFLVNDQKQFCTPSRATDNVIMIGFLKRFISVRVRAKLVLKDLKGKTGKTLFHDYREVYDFIVQVFKAGYEVRNKILTNSDVQSVLRVVWGRSKQMLNEGKKSENMSRK